MILNDKKFKDKHNIEKWKLDSYNLLSIDNKWVKESTIKII